tara:strand:- start:325 stop:450 length:126 start_codon:yes stop_codon:yes gene_type:complete
MSVDLVLLGDLILCACIIGGGCLFIWANVSYNPNNVDDEKE